MTLCSLVNNLFGIVVYIMWTWASDLCVFACVVVYTHIVSGVCMCVCDSIMVVCVYVEVF